MSPISDAPVGHEPVGDGPARDPLSGPRLYVVRHGQTPSNVAMALDTALPGAPLTELGREQAQTVGEALAGRGAKPKRVFSSEAHRARETAALLAGQLGVGADTVSGAHEVSAGDLEMRTDMDSLLAYHAMVQSWLVEGQFDARLPGGESAHAVGERILPVLGELRDGPLSAGEDAVLVIHGTLMRVLAVLLGAVPGPWALDNRIPNCGVIELSAPSQGWACHQWNGLVPPG